MSKKTLLFADDSATMREIMRKTFAAEDVDVLAVSSGEAALEKAQEAHPDIIIADAGMAGITGYDVCRSVRGNADLSSVPVVIMSGVSNPYEENLGREAGVTEHLKKPFDTTRFIQRINEICAEHRVAGRAAPQNVVAAARAAADSPIKETMEFGRPIPTEPEEMEAVAVVEPEPLEIIEQEQEPLALDTEESEQGEFQVGTLAELAQMDRDGSRIPHDPSEAAIAVEEPQLEPIEEPEIELTATPSAPIELTEKVVVSGQVARAAEKASRAVVSQIEGLTSDQAEAIAALTSDVVERVVWEVVPDLAETIIKERIEALLKE